VRERVANESIPPVGDRPAAENTPCGDAGGWTALPVWESAHHISDYCFWIIKIESGIQEVILDFRFSLFNLVTLLTF
jgi:hypothetical protein